MQAFHRHEEQRVKIIVVGATGVIGSAVASALAERHEVVRASRRGDVRVDIEDPASIASMYTAVGEVDAVVCAAGRASFGALAELSDDAVALGLESKLLGRVNLVRLGLAHVRDGGSFTLTSGVLAKHPVPGSAAITMTNAALEGFVRAAALELPRGLRVNVVSPGWVAETLEAMGRDPSAGTRAADVAKTYARALEHAESGAILEP
jgi:NAD(P)-dependent dehydrogenase (short-subunit alcohol dehydrogenase family)